MVLLHALHILEVALVQQEPSASSRNDKGSVNRMRYSAYGVSVPFVEETGQAQQTNPAELRAQCCTKISTCR
ncbi:hypothetical protein V5799_009128 [Amblyomma americanum]|uniref:Secreted protein n=1 Tax=Amblyomma americanum TaxID=6943 RepID=A0AAQ4FB87_AMBAM